MSAKQIQQIYQYIQANGNFLSSQKVLKEIQKHPEIVWQLIAKLYSKLKNKNIQNAYAQIVYMLNDPAKHQRSSKWLKEYMDLRDLSIKLGSSYLVMDYLKPEKEKIINLIYKIVEVSKGVNKLKMDLDELIVRDESVTKEMNKVRLQEESTKIQLQEMKERKLNEKPIYDQKVDICYKLNQQIISKRQAKLDQILKQKSIKDEFTKRQAVLDEVMYENSNKVIKIEQLKKQIAQNAPAVKKEKRAVQEEHQQLEKQVYTRIQLTKHKQIKIRQGLAKREVYRHPVVELAKNLVENFNLLDETRTRYTKIKDENQALKKRKALVIQRESSIIDQTHNLQMASSNEGASKTKIIRHRQRIQEITRQIISKVTVKKTSVQNIAIIQSKFKKFNDSLRERIQKTKKNFDETSSKIENDKKLWDQMVAKSLSEIYAPLEELKFE